MKRVVMAVGFTMALLLSSCESGQDPGIETDSDGPATTSVTLGSCPDGGPDATTPPAGCLDKDGTVLRPS